MNFTREPIILSVITPKEGCKLVVRNSKGFGKEDYFVDAIEIISFGNSSFFRSLERPKTFLLPTNDYEIFEVKETKMVLKTISTEKSIKIGKDNSRDKKNIKKRRPKADLKKEVVVKKGGDKNDEVKKPSSSTKRHLLSPPNTLIKEKLKRIKDEEFFEENILPGKVDEEKDKKKEK